MQTDYEATCRRVLAAGGGLSLGASLVPVHLHPLSQAPLVLSWRSQVCGACKIYSKIKLGLFCEVLVVAKIKSKL